MIRALAALALAVLLAACGQKGPLKLLSRPGARHGAGRGGTAHAGRAAARHRASLVAMKYLEREGGELRLDGVALAEVARRFGTPCYVYSRSAIEDAFRAFDQGLAGVDHLVCYAVKANSNLAILDLLARAGAGFDIVSGGELARVLAAGGTAERVIFSGVGKSEAEMRAALAAGIRCFNVESEPELDRLDALARAAGVKAPVALRINPDVDARTHPYISTGMAGNKFGIPHANALAAYRRARSLPNLRIVGIGCHIGSQILDSAPLDEALERVLELVAALRAEGVAPTHIDLGGGFGIRYRDERPIDVRAYCAAARRAPREPRHAGAAGAGARDRGPGGPAPHARRVPEARQGDALRGGRRLDERADPPRALRVVARDRAGGRARRERPVARYDVVGPVCESSDVLGVDRALAIAEGDLLAVLSAGAYGDGQRWRRTTTRARCPREVLVDPRIARS